jgi:hypothetical protein
MIYINHEKKAIFIHIPKTGGTYIGPTLVKYYGFTSYLNLIVNRRPDHEQICYTTRLKKNLTGNYLYDNTFFNKVIGLFSYCKTSEYLSSYMKMDEEKWNTYTKFCFIRNPYSRFISGYNHFNTIFKRNISLFEYLNKDPMNEFSDIEYGHIFMSQKRQIQYVNGVCGVDLIGRFEHLDDDLRIILKQLGFTNINHPIKKVNVSNNSGSDEIMLDVKTIKKINDLFLDDFNSFHYKMIDI